MVQPTCPRCGEIGEISAVELADDISISVEGGSAVLHPTCANCEEPFTIDLDVVNSRKY